MPDTPAPDSSARAILMREAARWLGSASRRHSRRNFVREPVEAETLARVGGLCESWRPYADARVVLVDHPATDVFRGIVGSYGKVVGAPHVLLFLGRIGDFADQHMGYTGEAIVLEAAALGLDTCWIGGAFSAKRVADVVQLLPGERVFAVSPLGHATARKTFSERTMSGIASSHHRKLVAEIAPDSVHGEWPAWAVAAVETARVAPSAMNRQPWRFRFEGGSLVVAKDSAIETPKVTKRLDIGIAMLHAEIAARAHGVSGTWTDLSGANVARFDPDTPA